MREFKKNHTTRMLPVHVNNFMSNFLLMDLMDVRFNHFLDALNEIIKKGKLFQEAMDNAVIGNGMLEHEIRRDFLEPLLKEIKQQNRSGGDDNAKFISVLGLMDRLWAGLKTADRKMEEAYQWEDDIFRLAAYMRRVDLGDTKEEAAKVAREQFVNYDIRAPWVNLARETGFRSWVTPTG